VPLIPELGDMVLFADPVLDDEGNPIADDFVPRPGVISWAMDPDSPTSPLYLVVLGEPGVLREVARVEFAETLCAGHWSWPPRRRSP
jgi:hypothetical protein